MMEQFTVEQINLLCFFDTSNRNQLIQDLTTAIGDFDDTEIIEIAQNTLNKVSRMSGDDFAALDFYPIYDDDEQTEVYS